ncbi:hypothetical protein [Streptomyces umbrinus]|uniref:hypothetical protein n=1 Tax=Streptomyces umbrinus TaxID=67370 RepID=UPI0033E8B10C
MITDLYYFEAMDAVAQAKRDSRRSRVRPKRSSIVVESSKYFTQVSESGSVAGKFGKSDLGPPRSGVRQPIGWTPSPDGQSAGMLSS